jgi:tetratricopeptide (TPR) repeat protein
VYRFRDNFVDGVHMAIAAARATGNRGAEIGILNCLGSVFYARYDYRGALQQFQYALALAEQDGDPEGLPASLRNVGSAHLKLGVVEVAIRLYQRAPIVPNALVLCEITEDRLAKACALQRVGGSFRHPR